MDNSINVKPETNGIVFITNHDDQAQEILTDETTLEKKAKYKRKGKANLTEEQRAKRTQYYKNRRAKIAENLRNSLADLCKEQQVEIVGEKLIPSKYVRNRQPNLSVEQRTKRLPYFNNLRAKIAYDIRKRRANLSNEQQAEIIENETIPSIDERQTENAECEQADLTEEQCGHRTENQKKPPKIKDVCTKRTAYQRKHRADIKLEQSAPEESAKQSNKKIEQQEKKLTNSRKKRVVEKQETIPIDEETIQIENNENADDNSQSNVNECLNFKRKLRKLDRVSKESKMHMILEMQNPLNLLIREMFRNDFQLSTFDTVDQRLFRHILQLLSINYPEDIQRYNLTLQKLNYEIDIVLLIALIKNWDVWTTPHMKYSCSLGMYRPLLYFLIDNFPIILINKDKFLLDEINTVSLPMEYYVGTCCSEKQLKHLFFQNPENYTTFYQEFIYQAYNISAINNLYYKLNNTSRHFIFNWSHISTRMHLHNFSMIHNNNHDDEYTLLNLTNVSKPYDIEQIDMNLFVDEKNYKDEPDTFLACFITKFLYQLTMTVSNRMSNLTPEKKHDILKAITELLKDISLCTNVIETNRNYSNRLCAYPYVRYLGVPYDGSVNMTIADQVSIDNHLLNVRLQQIRYPKISFVLEKFAVQYEEINEDIHFIFDEVFLASIDDCILYKCTLCNKYLGSSSVSPEIYVHMVDYHGFEPDWECMKCNKTFDNDYLTSNRWSHECIASMY